MIGIVILFFYGVVMGKLDKDLGFQKHGDATQEEARYKACAQIRTELDELRQQFSAESEPDNEIPTYNFDQLLAIGKNAEQYSSIQAHASQAIFLLQKAYKDLKYQIEVIYQSMLRATYIHDAANDG